MAGRLLLGLVAALLALHLFAAVTFFLLRDMNPLVTALQVQRRIEAVLTGTMYTKRQSLQPMARISRHLRHAVVAAEDGGFFDHGGIDWDELQNALEENEHRRRIRGGSTITQQLVKNLFFGTRVRWLSKPFDFTLAPMADAILGKDRTLEIYLNVVEWGPGVFGAEAAARHHYRTGAASLGREQAARLAACLPAPRKRKPGAMNRYSRIILTRMAGRGW
jgi:monofunctional biosynthetic peptidoglycan transglycosylase